MAAQVLPQSYAVHDSSSEPFDSSLSDKQSPPPIPSYSFPPRPSGDEAASPFPNSFISTATPSHRRARTSIRIEPQQQQHMPRRPSPPSLTSSSSSLAPSAPADTLDPFDSKTFLSLPQPSPSPTRSRHRRVVTEFGGGHNATLGDRPSPIPASRSSSSLPESQDSDPSAYKGHRHRRSGAVSKDFTSFLSSSVQPIPGEFNRGFVFGGSVSPRPDMQTAEAAALEEAGPRQSAAVEPNLRSVEFADTVEVIPRPLSLVSSQSGSSQSTVRDTASAAAASASGETGQDERNSTPDSHSHSFFLSEDPPDSVHNSPDQSFDAELSDLDVTDAILSANFDQETSPEFYSEPGNFFTSETDPSPVDSIDYMSRVNPARHSLPKTGIHRQAEDPHAAVIDLDFAEVGDRPTSASGLERKPASMASYHRMGGFLAVGGQRHRRAESAPLLAPPSFSASFRSGSVPGEMYDGEHVLEKVFEEDEDEADDVSVSPSMSGISPGSSTGVDTVAKDVPRESRSRSSHVSDGRGTQHVARTSPFLLPAIQFDLDKSRHNSLPQTGRQFDADLPSPQPAFAAHELRQGSAASSPKVSQSIMSSAEPSPRFRQSVDDVPSLISGSSTMGSFMHPSFPATASSASLDPGRSISESTHSQASSSNVFHRKRASIISLSRLVGLHATVNEERQAYMANERSQSSSDLRPPKRSKARRLSRMLKFWGKNGHKGEGIDRIE